MADMIKIGKSNSRRGKSQERRVARLFSKWTGHEFRRRRVEGRTSTVIERESTADVIPVSRQSIFSIEVKNAAGFSLDAIMNNPTTTKFTDWWFQCSYDALLMTKFLKKTIYPFLFFKPSPTRDWVAFPTKIITHNIITQIDGTINHDNIWFPALRFDIFASIGPISRNISNSKNNPVMVPLQLEPCYFCRWNDFSKNINPASIFYL